MAVKENIKNTYQYIKTNEKTILSDKHSLKNYDIMMQVTNLLGAVILSGIGFAVYTAIIPMDVPTELSNVPFYQHSQMLIEKTMFSD